MTQETSIHGGLGKSTRNGGDSSTPMFDDRGDQTISPGQQTHHDSVTVNSMLSALARGGQGENRCRENMGVTPKMGLP